MIIKNFEKLAKTEDRKLALRMIDVGLDAVDTKKIIRSTVHIKGDELYIGNAVINLKDIDNLFVVGVGKASLSAAEELESILGKRISNGVVIDVREGNLKRISAFSGQHPFPSEVNMKATKEIIKLLSGTTKKDFVIFIISGGGSTLLCQPKNMTCSDESEFIKLMFDEGVDIEKMNTVRKHLSFARGGYLAKYAYPARAISLIFSDVPGDDLQFIASGPTVKDTTTTKDALRILQTCKNGNQFGVDEDSLIETPKDDKYFKNIRNIIVVSNKIALTAMAKEASSEGFLPEICTTTLSGEARDVGRDIVHELRKAKNRTVFLYGGETTVTVRNPGKGGRCQELILSALRFINKGETVVAVGSDGRDNTDFAGALCDTITKDTADKKNLNIEEYLNKNMAYSFFEKTGDYILTGNTGRNVSDIIIAIKNK